MIRKPRTEKNFMSENPSEMTTVGCLNRIFKKVEVDGLSQDAAAELADDILSVAGTFGISPKAAVLLAAILEKSRCNNCCDEEDLANYIGCTNIEFFGFHEALRQMEDGGVIRGNSSRLRGRKGFTATMEAIKAVENGTPFKPLKMVDLTSDELFTRFRMHIGNFRNDNIDCERLSEELESLIEKNPQLLFCRKAMESHLTADCTDTERRMFFYLAHRYVSHGEEAVPLNHLLNFTDYMEDEQILRRQFANEKNALQIYGLVEFGFEEGFGNDKTLSLSEEVRNTWFDEIELALEDQAKHRSIIPCDSIKEQELFYNQGEQEQIERLTDLLSEDNYNAVCSRLKEQGMPSGFSCIFHGCPGSGKTASLRAIAKKTGRDLFWVDLSSIQSKWVGDSEKNMKALFNAYRRMVKSSKKAPIMAVNEADAIFTKRFTTVERSVEASYNAVTDIVLNELETLDGILIATTNLAGNMMDDGDSAMERRFLYKVELTSPSKEVREKIWKSKISGLSQEDAAELASRYEFSGGNIENIARKSTVEYVLSGRKADLGTLIGYCEEENIVRKGGGRKKIGFAG